MMIEQRIYHGEITPKNIAQALMGELNRGNYIAQSFGTENNLIVQIATKEWLKSGGETAISVTIRKVEDGVSVQVGKQAWLGVAASLGQTFLSTWRNPWNLLNRLDDLAQDIQSIQLTDRIFEVIDDTTRSLNVTHELSTRLRRLSCEYCGVANPVGEPACIACGAPLGRVQPFTCLRCGFVIRKNENRCPNCGNPLIQPK